MFKADNDRVSEYLKIKVFQTYFQRVCIDQTLWINNNGTFQSNEISLFASCQPNYDYLISIIKDYKNQHRRTVHSALDLLKYFNIPFNEIDRLKLFFINKLKEKDFNLGLKADVLRIIYIQKLTNNDEEYLKNIFLCFKNSTQINEFNFRIR